MYLIYVKISSTILYPVSFIFKRCIYMSRIYIMCIKRHYICTCAWFSSDRFLILKCIFQKMPRAMLLFSSDLINVLVILLDISNSSVVLSDIFYLFFHSNFDMILVRLIRFWEFGLCFYVEILVKFKICLF